ncbi:hypothetical protein LQZ18_06955 [Lachnospiraceae bacterium ZAX-1]
MNTRGLNFVVYDNETNKVIDSAAFDTYDAGLGVNRTIVHNIATVKAEELSQVKTAGTPWDEKGNVAIPKDTVLKVEFSKMQHASGLVIALDSGDYYNVTLCQKDQAVAFYEVKPNGAPAGLSVQEMPLSGDFDSIRIQPHSGDGNYSVGYLEVLK